ncbi:hypothetical protein V565_101510 [Rhizoctonia solani 123E]|uniref:Uncharacterized protein n=1 Tax=Rhizoctonia solani 123E TaxID=1423351 RepID=A0A074RXM4_9AGAM|nr:hypothetical protein V565_101510 [Rhizoctonia solani 123E]
MHRLVDIELFARGSHSLGTHLASFISALPNLESFALRLPTYRVFRNVLTSDLRASFSKCASVRVRTLCVDTDSAWLIPLFPNLRELIVWSWPRPGREEDDRAGGWSVVLGSTSPHLLYFLI